VHAEDKATSSHFITIDKVTVVIVIEVLKCSSCDERSYLLRHYTLSDITDIFVPYPPKKKSPASERRDFKKRIEMHVTSLAYTDDPLLHGSSRLSTELDGAHRS